MDPGTRCLAARRALLLLYLDKTRDSFYSFFFVCLFDFCFSFSCDQSGCWVDRHMRFFCAHVFMFHLWGETAAALIIDPLLVCSVRWKEKQLLPAGIKLQLRNLPLWSTRTCAQHLLVAGKRRCSNELGGTKPILFNEFFYTNGYSKRPNNSTCYPVMSGKCGI